MYLTGSFFTSRWWSAVRPYIPRVVRKLLSRVYVAALKAVRKVVLLGELPLYVRNWGTYLLVHFYSSRGPFQVVLRNGLHIQMRPATYDDYIIREIFCTQSYRAGLEALEAESSPTVLDLGAHIGTFSLMVAHALPRARILAVEAVPENASYLRVNVEQNGFSSRVRVFAGAVAATSGTLTMYLRDRTAQHSAVQKSEHSITVPALTLDELVARAGGSCDLLKLDIEGSEFEVLEAASAETLSRIKTIIMEYHPFAGDPRRLVSRLSAQGFSISESIHGPLLFAVRAPTPSLRDRIKRLGYAYHSI